MHLTLKIARILLKLLNGGVVNSSEAKSKLIDDLLIENILWQKGKHHKTLHLSDESAFTTYLANQLQINDLKNYIDLLENKNSSRADFTKITGDSKHSKNRVFKGFLVNSYQPIQARLNHKNFTINPANGSFIFIHDFENFVIDKNITIVGVENSENFSKIHQQKYLFSDITPLFISRYPQNQSKDFIKWMLGIANPYLHFGDFDFAGINIYINEYQQKMGDRANFFIPDNINVLLKRGSRERYDKQNLNIGTIQIKEQKLLNLIKLIQQEKRGIDQEILIN